MEENDGRKERTNNGYEVKRLNEQVYHCGASSKDAGRKVCAINKVENVALVHPVVEGLLKNG